MVGWPRFLFIITRNISHGIGFKLSFKFVLPLILRNYVLNLIFAVLRGFISYFFLISINISYVYQLTIISSYLYQWLNGFISEFYLFSKFNQWFFAYQYKYFLRWIAQTSAYRLLTKILVEYHAICTLKTGLSVILLLKYW